MVAKGAFGVVFRVIDKNAAEKQQHKHGQQEINTDKQSSTPVYALKVLKKSKVSGNVWVVRKWKQFYTIWQGFKFKGPLWKILTTFLKDIGLRIITSTL